MILRPMSPERVHTHPCARCAAILEGFAKFTRERGIPPSRRDVCEFAKIPTTSSATYHIESLASRGLLRMAWGGLARGTSITEAGFLAVENGEAG